MERAGHPLEIVAEQQVTYVTEQNLGLQQFILHPDPEGNFACWSCTYDFQMIVHMRKFLSLSSTKLLGFKVFFQTAEAESQTLQQSRHYTDV